MLFMVTTDEFKSPTCPALGFSRVRVNVSESSTRPSVRRDIITHCVSFLLLPSGNVRVVGFGDRS